MGQVTGTVAATNDNYGKVNIQVNGGWYSTKKEWWKGPEPAAGDEVSFDDGGKNYIKYFKITGKGSGSAAPSGGASGGAKAPVGGDTFPVAPLSPKRTINRQNALTNAVKYLEGVEATEKRVVEVARYFEAYTTGDLDQQEAEAQAAAMFEGMQA